MVSPLVVAVLAALNLGLIFLLMAVPLGRRTIRMSRVVKAPRDKLWAALWPLGADAGWSEEILSAAPLGGDAAARLMVNWSGRDGAPIQRDVALDDARPGRSFALRVTEDSSLDASFWADYREAVELDDVAVGTRVTLSRTDRYRGLAFLVFRYFALRREIGKLKRWAETGRYRKGGVFEHPVTQLGLAVVSVLVFWPFFGLNLVGFTFALALTAAVFLHELGHILAFRVAGHRSARMIFVPLLGGIAIGGRPYDSRFEVAFVALMGAGFSAFLVPLAIAGSEHAQATGLLPIAALLGVFAGCSALFNLGNLVPVWKFDGGQVLRQIFPTPAMQAIASFALLSAFLALGHMAGFHSGVLVAGGLVFAALSLITAGSGVKLRHELKPIARFERVAITAALLAVFSVHGFGVLWAAEKLTQRASVAQRDAFAPRVCSAGKFPFPEGNPVQPGI